MPKSKTLMDKIWDAHAVVSDPDTPTILYIDLHLLHEVTSPQAFDGLRAKGHKVHRPDRSFATMDHSTPTKALSLQMADALAAAQLRRLQDNCQEFGIQLYDIDNPLRGIVHVVGPELGMTQPGMTVVCGDSHTSTHGALGALAFGIGTSEVEHVLATQCLLQYRPRTFQVEFAGRMGKGITAKDIILALIAQIGVGGGTGHVFEYTGPAVRAMSIEARMTLCNMSIEGGARAGMVAPDDTTFEYVAGRQFAPTGEAWEKALTYWRTLTTDPDAMYDKSLTIHLDDLEPMITFGTNPGMGIPITKPLPNPADEVIPDRRSALEKAMNYMVLQPGRSLLGHKIDVAFIGSCANARISDLRQAAKLIKGRKVADNVRMLVVPGSESVRRQAEAEGLDVIFREAGADWRFSGCSMCIAMNGDQLEPGQYAVSTSNRNFEGRQGKGGRTLLASPLTVAASAVNGSVTDPRTLMI
ncbi:MAG: 3-isopropylmalate dehydratase large subunit [Candidatus Promineifilaceae bacterium]